MQLAAQNSTTVGWPERSAFSINAALDEDEPRGEQPAARAHGANSAAVCRHFNGRLPVPGFVFMTPLRVAACR
jgi:hypothetical protein